MDFHKIHSGFHHSQVIIGVGMIGVIGLLIIELSCTNVTFEKYIIQMTSTTTTPNATEFIPMVKSFIIVSSDIPDTVYCSIIKCKTINCISISSSDPVAIVSNFVTLIFKIQCPTAMAIENLIFKDCKFPMGQLKNSWQISNIKIDNIRFENCEISEIIIGAFATNIFTNTIGLAIINTQITSLKSFLFKELANLRNLIIHDNIIIEAEYNLLNAVADNLQTIELDRSIINLQVLYNITTGKQLSQVQLVSLQGNNIPNLSQEILNGFPNILSLYMDSSKIINVNVNTFKSIHSIEQIFMNNNLITTLPMGLFDTILHYNQNFKLSITGNPWHCDCQLKWIYDIIIYYPKMFMTIPKCQTPEINNEKSFLNAEFCLNKTVSQNSTSTLGIEITTKIQNNPDESDNGLIKVSCEYFKFFQLENLRKTSLYISSNEFLMDSLRNFSLHEYDNGSVAVNINNNETVVTILWFSVGTNKIGRINCLKNVRKLFILNNLDKDTIYIICIMNEFQLMPTPFNCLGLKTKPSNKARTWLSNDDKPIVLTIYSLTLILFGLFGSGICLLIARKNPAILRGSSRVLMVRHGHVKALILPKKIRYSDIHRQRINKKIITTNDRTNVNYLTPIETRKSYLSNIYDSIRDKIISLNDFKMDEPPPLPPHPHHGIQQLQQQYQQHNHHHRHQLSSVSLRINTAHDKTDDYKPYQIEDDTGIYSYEVKANIQRYICIDILSDWQKEVVADDGIQRIKGNLPVEQTS